jgi:glycosyltransferase involved in cell wall biosynthesis
MRILIATPLYPPESGGPATYASILEEGLPSGEGTVVTIAKFSDVRRHPKIIRHAAYFFSLMRALRDADIVLALDPVSVGFPAMLAALFSRKPYVVKIVGDYAWEQGVQRFGVSSSLDEFQKERSNSVPVFILRRIERMVARCAKAVIVPSEYLKRIVCGWGIAEEKVSVIYNAVSVRALGSVPDQVARLGQPLVVSVGRLVPWKNMPGVIDAVSSIQQDGVPASLAIVGGGPDQKEIASYAARAKNAVLTGELSHADTLAVIDRADVFVLNSGYEGLSHILIEALSLGVPVVATDVGGNSELVTHNVNGILVPVAHHSELVSAIRHLFDRAEAERLTQGAADTARRFSKETMIGKTASLLRALV